MKSKIFLLALICFFSCSKDSAKIDANVINNDIGNPGDDPDNPDGSKVEYAAGFVCTSNDGNIYKGIIQLTGVHANDKVWLSFKSNGIIISEKLPARNGFDTFAMAHDGFACGVGKLIISDNPNGFSPVVVKKLKAPNDCVDYSVCGL